MSYADLEAAYFAREARARHARFREQLATATIGGRTTILLLAATDADLEAPASDEYELKLVRFVGVEIHRRYPGHTPIAERVREQVREQLLGGTVLAEQLDTLGKSRQLRRNVTSVHREISDRLGERAAGGWKPDVEGYRRAVLQGGAARRRVAA